MTFAIHRRSALGFGAAAVGVALWGASTSPALAKNDAQDLIKAFTGGKDPIKGKVKLDIPEIAENGNNVPMTVTVESPMTSASYVERVLVVADGNPRGGIASFNFSAETGIAEANTRIRLAETQNIIAVAKMSDGSFYTDTRQVKVTIGGCGG